MTQAKFYPIIFSAEMMRAILAGKKTQTRRVMKPQPKPGEMRWTGSRWEQYLGYPVGHDVPISPYGLPGDQLWVRETMTRWSEKPYRCTYDATRTGVVGTNPPESYCGRAVWQWKLKTLPSIFMPRWASRITLEITQIRIERLQQIGGADAWAEGEMTVEEFIRLWDSINEKSGYGWIENCWVWVIEFKAR